ncbi:MAG: hypothetical protein FWD26_11235 [Treponema sp.]|nr:hypothetical protein [Treponema sp.]
MRFKDFSLKWWWYGLVDDFRLACENELHALEEPVRRNAQGLIPPNSDIPHGWIRLSEKSKLSGDKNLIICDAYKCLFDSPQHKAIRSRYEGKIFQRRLSFFQPVILTISGLAGIVSIILQFIK